MAPFRARPLQRFYLVLALMALTLVTAMSTGFGLFYRLVYVLVLTTIVNYVWNWLTVRAVEVNVESRTRQSTVGDIIAEQISIRNKSWLPKQALEIDVLTDLPDYSGGMVVNLMGHASNTWKTQATARKRGVYKLGPVRVANTDPFALFRREVLFGETETVTVYPKTFNISGFHMPTAELSGESSERRRTHNVTPHASSVREYSFGDSLSRVHWNSTARLGKLMSKVFDLGRAGELWLLMDLHKDVQSGELEESTDEYGVSITASLAKKFLASQEPIGLISYGDQRYYLPAETGAGQFERMMQYLAMSKAEGSTPLEEVLATEEAIWGPQSLLVVITSSPYEEWGIALRELGKRGVRVAVVLLDGNSFGGFLNSLDALDELYLSGIPTYVVKKGDDIATSLERQYTGAQLATPEQLEVGAGS